MCFFAAGAAGAAAASAAAMTASTAAAVAGIVVSAVGASKQADYQSKMMERNARMEEMRAEDAKRRGREEESRLRMNVFRIAGTQASLMAGRGQVLSSETPSSILEDTFMQGELDAAIIRENAAREAWGYGEQAAGYRAQAGLFQQAGGYNVGTSLLSGATSVADRWYQYKRRG